jgi:putative spermidine/putrescine transport system permease protein
MMHVPRGFGFTLVLCGAWMLACFLVAPLLITFPVSVTDKRFLSLPESGISFQHYATLFGSTEWLAAIGQSLFVAVVSTALAVALGAAAAIGSWRLASRFGNAVRLLLLAPLIIPSIVHALAFYKVFVVLDLLDTFTGIILVHTVTGLPYVVIGVSASLANFDVRIDQAARSLGASMTERLWFVILPGVMPGLASGTIFAFVHSWDEIVVLLFVTARRVRMLPRLIWDGINEGVDPTVAAVASLMILLTMLAVAARWLADARQDARHGATGMKDVR